MGIAVSAFSGAGAAVFLLAENRLLREALLRILSKKEDIHVVGEGLFGPEVLGQIAAARADLVVLDSVSPVLAEPGIMHQFHQLNPAIRVVMVGMEAEEGIFLRVVQAGVLGYVLKTLPQSKFHAPFGRLPRAMRFVRLCFLPHYFAGWHGINR